MLSLLIVTDAQQKSTAKAQRPDRSGRCRFPLRHCQQRGSEIRI